MSILEAWAYSLPVLMTRACNLPEGFASNSAIEISTNSNVLAEQLIEFTGLPESEHERIGMNGRLLVESKFQWHKIAKQMDEVYAWILGNRNQPDTLFE